MTQTLDVGIAFGGRSVEHEVSVISGLQAAHALDESRHRPVPIYVSKQGDWYTGGSELLQSETYRDLEAVTEDALPVTLRRWGDGRVGLEEVRASSWWSRVSGAPERIDLDVLFVALHGGPGENGGLQGLCETIGLPYTGSGVLGSALGMDKAIAKRLCREAGIAVVAFESFRESEWAHAEEEHLDRCEEALDYPMVVKPARLGSSIGIARVEDREELDGAIEDAFRYGEKVLVERAVRPLRELNCAVLGDRDRARASAIEEPVRSGREGLLSFRDKYQRGEGGGAKSEASGGEASGGEATGVGAIGSGGGGPGAGGSKGAAEGGMASQERVVPAEIPEELADRVRERALRIFDRLEAAGVARIDFIWEEASDTLYFNEINTVPGSFSFYLWEPAGVSFEELTGRMIELAGERHRSRRGRLRSYDTNLLREAGGGFKTGE